ncbi:MAG TPA: nuclear transport factor 2 family protein [Pyrinomonadaceae bacterium]|nr:nuclear transport factor 2 family protein [Pyrinomonadaceae bacterium]
MSSNQSAQPGSKVAAEQELRQLNDEWVKALVRRDTVTLERVMADDFVSAYPLEGDDKSQFIGDVVSGDLAVEYLNRENVTVRIWGDAAVLTGRDSAKWNYKGREFAGHYKILHVYSRRGERWQMVALQACPIP